jgi:hypothetical protein
MEFWERHMSLDGLSRQRQNAKFVWINESEQINLIHISYLFDVQNQDYVINHFTKKVGIGTGGVITLSLLCFVRYLHLH